MSLNEILGSALSGLAASQAGLRTVSNNIANVATPGYAREQIALSTGVTAGRVTGVVVGEPSRIADRFLQTTVYQRAGDLGRADVTANYLDQLQAFLGAPGAEQGLPARLDAISAAATTMTGSPGSEQDVASFTSTVQDALLSMQQTQSDVDDLRGQVESEVGYTVDRINTLLQRIYTLNDTVSQMQGLGRSASGAADQRDSAIEELSGLVSITVREQSDGRVTIDTASGAALLDKRLRQLSYPTAGQGVSQPVYPTIGIRFADGPSTGESLDSAAVGGKLGGLLDLRDRALPQFSDQLGTLYGGLAQQLNAVSNAFSAVPPPNQLAGRTTALTGTDALRFTGAANFAVTAADGTLVASTHVDFSALPAGATVDDAVAAINAGLAGSATASFTNGKLTITAASSANGVVVAQDETSPSDRGGVGFAQYFGLNDLIRSEDSTLAPSGFTATDPHGFAAGQSVELTLRDTSGRALTTYTLTPAAGGTFGDLVSQLNASPLGGFGDFSLDTQGRIQFDPDPSVAGAALSIPADTTDRFGTGRSFSSIVQLTGASSGLASAEVRPDMLADPAKLPLAQLQTSATVGQRALGSGDIRGATAFVDTLAKPVDLGSNGTSTISRFASLVLGGAGTQAAQADDQLTDATSRHDDAVNRRDSFSGVNIDEELSQMVVLQNSYSAAARVMTTASQMYDTLIEMVS